MTRATPIPETVTLHVPFRIVKRGGRKEMQMPNRVRPERTPDNALIKALARAFRWKRMLESGEFTTIAELAEREGIAPSYMTRVLRLTLLAPSIVEAILDGTQGPEVTLARLMGTHPVDWADQCRDLADRTHTGCGAQAPSVAGERRETAVEPGHHVRAVATTVTLFKKGSDRDG